MIGLKLSFYISIGYKLTYSFSGSYNKHAGLLNRLIKVMLEIKRGEGLGSPNTDVFEPIMGLFG